MMSAHKSEIDIPYAAVCIIMEFVRSEAENG